MSAVDTVRRFLIGALLLGGLAVSWRHWRTGTKGLTYADAPDEERV